MYINFVIYRLSDANIKTAAAVSISLTATAKFSI